MFPWGDFRRGAAGKIDFPALGSVSFKQWLKILRDTGTVGFEVNFFISLVSPKGLPADVAAKINADVLKVLADPEVKARYNTWSSARASAWTEPA